MSDDESVSRWLEGLKTGDDADIRRLWDRYFHRLVALAGSRLPGRGRRDSDEEDVALSAFQSFCERARRDQFPQLDDREDLWKLLSTVTARKAIRAIEHRNRAKRGGGRVLGESALEHDGQIDQGMAQIIGHEPTPESAAEFAEDVERLLSGLGNETLRSIALRKLEGHSSSEIAAELGISARSVDRKLEVIREIWGVATA
jgi:DNA-directed RNA polymerase specialized sigma24 family protein